MSGQDQFLLNTAPDGAVKVEVFYKDETVWLTQKALAELFGVKVPAINKHLKNIFESGELIREATVSKMEIVRAEGDREVACEVEFYNLDAIIAVDYPANPYETTQLRQVAAARICSSLSEPIPALMVRTMSETVERSSLDLRYEGYRHRRYGSSVSRVLGLSTFRHWAKMPSRGKAVLCRFEWRRVPVCVHEEEPCYVVWKRQ